MLSRIYIRTKEHYNRDEEGRGHRWQLEEKEDLYMSPNWKETLLAPSELAFFRALGAEVHLSRDNWHDTARLDNTSPSRLEKSVEIYRPINIMKAVRNAGVREQNALIAAENARVFHQVETSADRIVLKIGDAENWALLDLKTLEWVG